MLPKTGSYVVNSEDVGDERNKECRIWTICKEEVEFKAYTYDEAVNLTGTGWYTRGLLATLSLSLLSMAIDLFGISVIVTGCACEFQLDHSQKSILLSTPFLGPIIASYLWGHLADTRGRRWTLLIGLWGGFIASIFGAFSPNWYTLAILKIAASSFSSSAQAITFTFLGESIPVRLKGKYMQIMLAVNMLFVLSYDIPAYFILNLDFQYDWGFINFSPWRLLALLLATPLGISALILNLFYESPKFLINAGKEELALNYLRKIWRNNGNSDKYPVIKVIIDEVNRMKRKDDSMTTSLFDQIQPLFEPPLLWRTLQLFYLTAVMYSVTNSLVMWLPAVVEALTVSLKSGNGKSRNICDMIVSSKNSTDLNDTTYCNPTIDSRTLISGLAHGLIFVSITLCISKFGHRKKLFMITFFFIPMLCCFAAIYTKNILASQVLYVGITMTNLCGAFLFGYYVDLFPTSYRGMAGCLGALVSRASGLAGVYFVGAFIISNCTVTLYGFAIYLLSGIIVAYFLPSDVDRSR